MNYAKQYHCYKTSRLSVCQIIAIQERHIEGGHMILVNENTKLVVQGITGREGTFHAERCKAYGTNLVAGVTPGRGGALWEDTVPVFDLSLIHI